MQNKSMCLSKLKIHLFDIKKIIIIKRLLRYTKITI